MAFENSKPSRRISATKKPPPKHPLPSSSREVPKADRFMKNYINHPQTTCTHPVKWGLEIPSRLGGVRGQRSPRQTCDGSTDNRQTCSKTVLHTSEVYNSFFQLLWNIIRVTDGRTDRPTDKVSYRVACTRLKIDVCFCFLCHWVLLKFAKANILEDCWGYFNGRINIYY